MSNQIGNRFKRDIKLARKRGLKMELLDDVVTRLITTGKLSEKYKPHKLKGDYKEYWKYHIQSD